MSQAVQDTRGGLDGLVRDLQGLPHQLLGPLHVTPAVEPRDRLTLLHFVSHLYENLDTGARVHLLSLLLPSGAQSERRTRDARCAEPRQDRKSTRLNSSHA